VTVAASGAPILASTINRLLNPPKCKVYQGAAGQNIADNTNTALTWDSEEYDDLGMHSTSVQPTRITITSAAGDGKYQFKGTFFVPNRTDYVTIAVAIAKNGTNQAPFIRVGPNASNVSRSVQVETTIVMAVGDYAEVIAFQDNGANATIATPFGSSFQSVFECIKVSE
jgi:hypothetical protein